MIDQKISTLPQRSNDFDVKIVKINKGLKYYTTLSAMEMPSLLLQIRLALGEYTGPGWELRKAERIQQCLYYFDQTLALMKRTGVSRSLTEVPEFIELYGEKSLFIEVYQCMTDKIKIKDLELQIICMLESMKLAFPTTLSSGGNFYKFHTVCQIPRLFREFGNVLNQDSNR